MPSADRLITTPPPPPGIYCATCAHHSPRWAKFPQCAGCLYDKVLPSEYAIKYLVGFDAEAATAALRWWRGEWEEKHPGFQLVGDRERLFPEESAPSKHADRQTTLGRKLFYSRWKIVRAHPRGSVGFCAIENIPSAYWKDRCEPIADMALMTNDLLFAMLDANDNNV